MKDSVQSWLYSSNAAYIEGLYESYLKNPNSVSEAWREYFARLEAGEFKLPEAVTSHASAKARTILTSSYPGGAVGILGPAEGMPENKQISVLHLINAYRYLGHRAAAIDPLGLYERPAVAELELGYHALSDDDLDSRFSTGSLRGISDQAKLREILDVLKATYCGSTGVEFMHITSTEQKCWIQERLESVHGQPPDDAETKRRILKKLVAAKGLEEYLHRKYVGQKRFSLEGGSSLIPLLDALMERAGHYAVKEVVFGMAHRGRLNVLVNIFGKSTEELFREFEGTSQPVLGSGDVKYHKGFSADVITHYGTVHAVLAFNPSHLEVIDPVVEGSVRARQQRRQDSQRNLVLPVLVHGDAAFSGQGVVMETLNLSKTRGYGTGGTIHIIVNNQIGFTTSDPLDSRSTLYCSDVAKMIQAPIFHVNGNDPAAVVMGAQMALDFRVRFNSDVVVDMVCFRRHGHSEADEPTVTQPIMYQKIKGLRSIRDLYANQLIEQGTIEAQTVEWMKADYLEKLTTNRAVSEPLDLNPDKAYRVGYIPYLGTHWTARADTTISLKRISALTEKMVQLPAHITPHRRVAKILEERRKMGQGEVPMDWGFAETLAYASLLEEGYAVRLSGQDTVRGTFAHRHAGVHDQTTGEIYIPLQHLLENQPQFLPINSSLSELAVLGFEMGYSSSEPGALVIWEAQFGDFANNAQVIIDQFLSSSEAKWQRLCGLVLLLPHGYDGQGPEHSSARLERFLQLCAEDNIQVCVPSTPAQLFHMLRRQLLRPYRKPLIVMSPKSLLRYRLSTSSLAELTDKGFQTVIDEIDEIDPRKVSRLLLCSGKVYFELLETRREHRLSHIAIIRIEQQYPFPATELSEIIHRYPRAKDVVWVQEEPRNQGAWYYMQSRRTIKGCLSLEHHLDYAGRAYSASPAVGYLALHRSQQKELIETALQLAMPLTQQIGRAAAN